MNPDHKPRKKDISRVKAPLNQDPDKSAKNRTDDYYRQIVNAANVAIVKFDKNAVLIDFSGNSEKIFGFKKEEVIGRKLEDTIVPKIESTGRDLGKVIRNVIHDAKSLEYNLNENITKDGRRIWMQWYNSEIKDGKNRLAGILSIGMNVTDRINTEIALKESEERFKTLSNLTFEGILIHDRGIILDINLSLERQIGYSREELIGTNLLDKLIPSKYHAVMRENFIREKSQYEIEAVHKNGTVIPISIESKHARINDRDVRVAAVRNISDLKKTIRELDRYKNHLEELVKKRTNEIKLQSKILKKQNEILQFERNELRTIIDNIPDTIYIKDKESRFLNANIRQLNYLGKTELSEIVGKNDFDFYNNEYANAYYADERNLLKTGLPLIEKEEPCLNEKGEPIFILTTKVVLKDKNGKIKGLVGIGRDITEKKLADTKLKVQAQKLKERKEELEAALEQLKNAQNQLVQSEKMASLGILLAGIAHEINNPVNFVYAGVNSVMKDFEDIKSVMENINSLHSENDPANPVLQKIEKLKEDFEFDIACRAIAETLNDIKLGATRISEIVNGLSRFSRLENEKWKKSDIHEELDSVLILLKNKYKHHIEIIKEYDDRLPEAECHPGKLNQVFMNIINNAIDAIEGNPGTITIKTRASHGYVTISIKDTGKGIPEEDKPKIFDPFFSTKEVGSGMGLGLSISYSIMQEHKGEIIVNSTRGKGTEFVLKIPLIQRITSIGEKKIR